MSITYNIVNDYATKDDLPNNDPNKVISGVEFTQDFVAIQSAFVLAAPALDSVLTGTTTATTLNVADAVTATAFVGDGAGLTNLSSGAASMALYGLKIQAVLPMLLLLVI